MQVAKLYQITSAEELLQPYCQEAQEVTPATTSSLPG